MTMHFRSKHKKKTRQSRLDFNGISEQSLKVTDFWIFLSIIVFLFYIDQLADISINRASPTNQSKKD